MDIPILVDVLSDFFGMNVEMITAPMDGKLITKLQYLLVEVIVFQIVKFSVWNVTKIRLHTAETKASRAAQPARLYQLRKEFGNV